MFFSDDPKEFEPLEKELLDEMLAEWELELVTSSKPNKATDINRGSAAA